MDLSPPKNIITVTNLQLNDSHAVEDVQTTTLLGSMSIIIWLFVFIAKKSKEQLMRQHGLYCYLKNQR